jgi:hypothetical protein
MRDREIRSKCRASLSKIVKKVSLTKKIIKNKSCRILCLNFQTFLQIKKKSLFNGKTAILVSKCVCVTVLYGFEISIKLRQVH